MSTVEVITAAIAALPLEQIARVRAWLAERDADDWDRQIEADVAVGRLDTIADRALPEHCAGLTRPF